MLHAGMGATHVNALLSSLNIPPVHGDTLKAREREIGTAIEDIANTSQWGSTERVNETVPIGASYDMGWQKRGKGHNSLTST